jgi:peptidase M48-like protein
MRAVLAFLFLLCGITAARAQCAPPYDWSGFYPPAALDRVAQRSAPGLRSNFEQVMLPRLTDAERRKLGALSRREYPEHPLNFYAATGRRVVLPLSSIKLVSDLSLALAWYNRQRLPEKRVFDYASMLAWRGPAPDGVKALPLKALGVPEGDAEPAVEGLFQKIFGTTMVYIMAHEIGHLFHEHRANVGEARSRQQESEADAFAVELMARLGAAPIGISFYFSLAAPFECPERSTHPLSGERINRLVAALRDNVSVFARNAPSPQQERQAVESIAQELGKFAKLLDDPDVRESMRLVGQSSKVGDFAAAARPGAAQPGASRQPFHGDYVGQWTDAKGVSLDFRMTLNRQGTTVRGTYEFGMGNAELEGTVTGDQLDYAWRWGTDYFGRGTMKSQANGELLGTWGYTRRNEGGGTLSAKPR